jgi:hypothetical protein
MRRLQHLLDEHRAVGLIALLVEALIPVVFLRLISIDIEIEKQEGSKSSDSPDDDRL